MGSQPFAAGSFAEIIINITDIKCQTALMFGMSRPCGIAVCSGLPVSGNVIFVELRLIIIGTIA